MRNVCADFETELVEFNSGTSHVRPLVNIPPKVTVSKLVNSLKDTPSRQLRKEFPDLATPLWPYTSRNRFTTD
ncbi:transposase [Streptomyces syringium]|uniref:transposase n=1 Tax=Streptomyces syringium TaxID=76729 RepID=UPI0036A96AA8